MQILKKSQRVSPKISIILLDWSVRESFHFLHYISKQNIDRGLFEIVIIEYYSSVSAAITPFAEIVDTWALLDMPKDAYYHKHLMYNAGLVMSQGEYIIICDSDAMARPTFLASVLQEFAKNPDIVLHIDQFRNHRRDFYPFNYPSFDEVIGRGCINYLNGKTTGMAIKDDIIHNRNYGACFCAKRDKLIAIGGADEHIDFIGHICGPYDLTFRLINAGCKEVWHDTEFLYHTWHPGQAGENNYLGPHDGRHMSTTSLEALYNFRVFPHVENPLVAKLRHGEILTESDLHDKLILPIYNKITKFEFLASPENREWANLTYKYLLHKGFKLICKDNIYYAVSRFINSQDSDSLVVQATYKHNSLIELKNLIDNEGLKNAATLVNITSMYIIISSITKSLQRKGRILARFFYIKLINAVSKPYKFLTRHAYFLINKLKNVKKEHNYSWENISSLLINIKLASSINQNITLFISSEMESKLLYVARKLKFIPKITIVKYTSFSEIKTYINNFNPRLVSKLATEGEFQEHSAQLTEPSTHEDSRINSTQQVLSSKALGNKTTELSQIILLSKQLYIDNISHFEGFSGRNNYFIV